MDQNRPRKASMRILFALPGLHRHDRGAEVAFIAIARELARVGHTVTLIGSGPDREETPYRFLRVRSIAREHFRAFPSMPFLRNDCAYEELTFIPDFLRHYRPHDFDFTLTCNYPFTNWLLRRPVFHGSRPRHIFVTENGDWPAFSKQSEYRFFGCDALVCTNPDFYERNRARWRSRLIPNGVDCVRFRPGPSHREEFGIPPDRLFVLMVSALITSKRVEAGIDAVSRLPNVHLVVAGDGPLRPELEKLAAQSLPGRFTRLSVPAADMPLLYQSADVFLHLSLEESFGNVFLEFMACGLPVVAHDFPRTRWIVGDDQFLTDTQDPENIARNIDLAAKTASLGHRTDSVEHAASFSWTKVGEMYQDLLQELIG